MYKLLKSSFLLLSVTLLASDDPHWRERYASSEGVEEAKGESDQAVVPIVLEQYAVTVTADRKTIEKFDYFKGFLEELEEDDEARIVLPAVPEEYFTPDTLRRLFAVVEGNQPVLDEMSTDKLIEVVELANFLQLSVWPPRLIDAVKTRLIDQANPELIKKIGQGVYVPVPKETFFPDFDKIYWNPSGASYFVKFRDDSGMLYRADGMPVAGSRLEKVFEVYWNPSGESYFVQGGGRSGMLYRTDGTPVVGSRVENIFGVYWNPSGANYFVKFWNSPGIFYRADGTPVAGSRLENASWISWNPSGASYFVQGRRRSGVLYHVDGTAVAGSRLENVFGVYWNPLGASYFVRFMDNSGMLYRTDGTPVDGSRLENVAMVYWNPSGASYFVEFGDRSGVLYHVDGTAVAGSRLENVFEVYWNPSGASYFVKFEDNSGMLYRTDGTQIPDSRIENISGPYTGIYWNPLGASYFVRFGDDSGMLYRADGASVDGSRLENVVAVYWNPLGTSYFVKAVDGGMTLYQHVYALFPAYRFLLDQRMLITYIENEYGGSNKLPVELDAALLLVFESLPEDVKEYFVERKMVKLPYTGFNLTYEAGSK